MSWLKKFIPTPQQAAAIGLLLVAVVAALWWALGSYPGRLARLGSKTSGLPRYGIAAGSGLPSLSNSELENYLATVQKTGAGWIRFDFDWSLVQPDNPTEYDWSAYDRLTAAAAKHHLNIVGIIDFTPPWARAGDCLSDKQCRPADTAAYSQFAASLSRRYGPRGVHVWEIWNEANTVNFWKPAPDVKQYAGLLMAASKRIHHEDQQAIILSASTAPASTNGENISPPDFIQGLYRQGVGTYFDAVGVHPYTFPLLPADQGKQAWSQMSQGTNSIRTIMKQNRDSLKKIWITEFGAPTGGPGPASTTGDPRLGDTPTHVDEALQADMLRQAVNLYRSYDWAGPFFWYSLRDTGTSADNNENFFGLLRADGSSKPAYPEFVKAVQG